jgi:hypothetical protein
MTCDQARKLLEELLKEKRDWEGIPELAEHLAGCQGCQAWYDQYLQVQQALEALPIFSVPPDFSQRVLASLPDPALRSGPVQVDRSKPVKAEQRGMGLDRWRERWSAFWAGLGRPRGRRQLVPVLVVAVSVILVVAALYGLQAGQVPPVSGAAMGSIPWAVAAGAGLLLLVLLIGLILWRRRR